MAYTIPEYVDTTEQAILAVASAVKGEQVTGGDGNVGTALDILADALAGENVTVPMTQQGAILALAQYVGGGGGGVTLGDINYKLLARTADDPEPAVGGDVLGYGTLALSAGYIGDTIAAADRGRTGFLLARHSRRKRTYHSRRDAGNRLHRRDYRR